MIYNFHSLNYWKIFAIFQIFSNFEEIDKCENLKLREERERFWHFVKKFEAFLTS